MIEAWKYLLIPHDAVMLSMSVSGLAAKCIGFSIRS